MVRKKLEEGDARRLLGGAPVLIVTTRWRAVANAFPVAWAMPLSVDPPLVGIAVHASRHSHDMIRFGEEFAINIPSRVIVNHTQWLGMASGLTGDKLEASRLPYFRPKVIESPLLEGCVGWIECTMHDHYTMGDHTLFVGRVVAAQADTEAFDFEAGLWSLADDEYKPLMYMGGKTYALLDSPFDAKVEQRSVEQMEEEGFGKELEEVEVERARKREEELEARDEHERRGEEPADTSALPLERPEA
ncbi:MAG: flavin reductase family protein [Dehalococcoidia bacterium]